MRPDSVQLAPPGAAPTDRATARAEVAARGLTAVAAEHVVRVALGGLPVSLVSRATTQLRRFFSSDSWSSSDDASLAGAVGPGKDWFEEALDANLTMGFGWRAGAFRVEVHYVPEAGDAGTTSGPAGNVGRNARTLGDTFEATTILEAGATPNELRFGIGPTTGPPAAFTRDDAAGDARVASLFRECQDLERVSLGSGTLTAGIVDEHRWPHVLLALFDAITAGWAPSRATPPDRQVERARREIGPLTPDSPRDLARILDATTSPDAAFRRIAIERLDGADALAGRAPWRRGLEDSSRPVRRATAKVLCTTAAPETRDLLEQALADGDACVRYYGVSGLARIRVLTSTAAVEALRRDPDVRVRLAVEAALDGRIPA